MDIQVEKESGSGMAFHHDAPSFDAGPEMVKREEIIRACKEGNLKLLVQLATSSGGLLSDDLRQSACMTVTLLASIPPGC